ncbi:mucin-associated surface protein [Trypanosoma cruzi cruzi]|uniref:Mucin-associated surface protein (MASP) n=1 Tax=Trypanosoma cruzi TaxID=5693 RepID=A0A2V2USQ4_TRYCR|nr:mucin-associated surface protein [Trypanosoma cruzi cruzi]PWU87149.1 Mucin-associated surface protein (MASP) [Trypanosoma cruzi]
MAMMMTGRVLLVCALCVLWCGAGGRCEEAGTADTLHVASSSVVRKGSQESSQIAQGGSQSSGLKASDMKDGTEDSDDQQTLTDVDDEEEEEEEEEAGSDEEDQDEDEDEDKSLKTPEEIPPTPLPPGGVPQAADGKLEKVNESGPKHENQRQVEGGTKKQPGKETEANSQMKVTKKTKKEGSGPQPNNHQTPVQEENTSSGEVQQPSQGKEQKTSVEDIPPRNPAGDRSSGEHNNNDGSNDVEEGEEGVEGHERHRAQEREEAAHVSGAPKVNSTDIQQEVQRTHAGETPTGMKQRAGEEKDDETEEEREEQKEQHQENPPGKQETITGANATNQINTTPGDSDGSTAVSHTTSPLLLLLVVACAAAAAVVAA